MPSRGGSASVLTAALSSGGTSVNSILSAAILSEVCASLAFCGACWHAARHNPAVRSTIRIVGDRKSVVEGKSVSVRVDLGGRRIMKQQKKDIYRYTIE